ncbi:hypothetical protein [Rhizobium tubonense]|uniref:Uncharacterized protein n=1 Tax=Rhizobium tubonense TaxID=484088 RepID=A0A2W4CSH2_9HYPH|nr:hypothetical protein [Rhizobium tubonense]PZM13788.1 hypothetical protein CPY51_13010 [Rhizobium tubonense]
MISPVNSLSSSPILSLFGISSSPASNTSGAEKLLNNVTGNTDDALKTGNALGTIIELVSGQKQSDTLFQMINAQKAYAAGGDYSETATGTGTVISEQQMTASTLASANAQAGGTGPEANRAKAYLDARAKGTLQQTDLSTMGVTATMTQTYYYHADGTESGESGTYDIKGLAQFLKKFATVGDDGLTRDKATGKYATVSQNGTKFTYNVF